MVADVMVGSFRVVILSAFAKNLRSCVESLIKHAPGLSKERIIVVDDGAKESYPDAPVTWVTGIKPFVFSRNANLGIARADEEDVILMNDDAALVTPGGFERLEAFVQTTPKVAICSAGISGYVGNKNQMPTGEGPRKEKSGLAFVCAYIPRTTFKAIGLLDERFVGYGSDDVDFCRRVLQASLDLWVYDGCVVHHGGRSTFRDKGNMDKLHALNREILTKKIKEQREKK